MSPNRTKLTPPELARRWGVSADKILAFIRSGQLRTCNVATTPNGRPRWLIDLADLAVFEQARTARPQPDAGLDRAAALLAVGEIADLGDHRVRVGPYLIELEMDVEGEA